MKMEYAVVKFNDGTVSEIPTSWLSKENNRCLWPNTKVASNYISRRISPSDDWEQHEVVVECFCNSLKKARKKAEDMLYTDETDTDKGRGKRLKKKKQLSHMTDEDETEDETQMEIGREKRQKRRKKSCDTSEEENLSKRNLPPPKVLLPWESQLLTSGNLQEESQILFISTPRKSHSQETRTELISPEIMGQQDIFSETTAKSVNEDPLNISFGQKAQDNLGPEDNLGTGDNSRIAMENSNCDHSTILRKILYSVTETKLLVGEIQKNLNETKMAGDQIKVITDMLPIKSLDEMEYFEMFCGKKENNLTLVKFLKSIGGKDSKEHIHRILKTFFEDSFAVKCSWLGQRDNIRIADLRVTNLLRNVILEVHGENNKQVEEICSNWFRHSKQRMSRNNRKDT